MANTSDVEQIKITRTKRIQDGVVRIEFVSGDGAKEFVKKNNKIQKIRKKKKTKRTRKRKEIRTKTNC